MKAKLHFYLARNDRSYVYFLKTNADYSRYIVDLFRTRKDFMTYSPYSMEEVACAEALIIKDDEFRALLTEKEKEVVEFIHRPPRDGKDPDEHGKYYRSSFDKWVKVFFKDKKYLYDELNPKCFGKVMAHIRREEMMSKTQLAEQLGVNRTTVIDIENGERLPSLEYIYKFSKIFMMSIDKLIELCLV